MNHKSLGLTGACLLFAGLFTPLIRLPVVGSMNYTQIGQEGFLLAGLAILSLLFVFTRWRRSLGCFGLTAMALVMLRLVTFYHKIGEMKSKMSTGLEGNPFRGLAELAAGA